MQKITAKLQNKIILFLQDSHMNFILTFLISATLAIKIETISGSSYEIDLRENDNMSAIYEKAAEVLSQHTGDFHLLLGNEILAERHLDVIHKNPEQALTAIITLHADFDSVKRFGSIEVFRRTDKFNPNWKIPDEACWDAYSQELNLLNQCSAFKYEVSIDLQKEQGRFWLEIDTSNFSLWYNDYKIRKNSPGEEKAELLIDSEKESVALVINGYKQYFSFDSNVRKVIFVIKASKRKSTLKWKRAPTSLANGIAS